MARWHVLVSPVFLSMSFNAAAGAISGNSWKQSCDSRDPREMSQCIVVIQSISEGLMYGHLRAGDEAVMAAEELRKGRLLTPAEYIELPPPPMFACVPDSVTQGQIRDVVLKSISESPATRHEPLAKLAFWSLRAAFPCGSRSSSP